MFYFINILCFELKKILVKLWCKMNYTETLNYIHSLGNFSKEPTLDRIKEVLWILGNPQNNFKAIHIAGTNGKGSVSAMLSRAFVLSGYKTALFVSPFIIDFCERIQINGEFISKDELCSFAQKIIDTKIELTEFEFITAMAFLYFSDKKCEIAVIETGLGGRLDATNTMENVVANVITKIGLDHTAILGDTIEKITKEKCGIIKNCPVVTTFKQPSEALRILQTYNPIIPDKSKLQIILSDISGNTYIYNGEEYKTSLAGAYQIENSLMVVETLKILGVPYDIIYRALSETYFPARMEVISKSPLVILDGAHNPDAAAALAEALENHNGNVTALVGMMKDKDCDEVLKLTLPYCKNAVLVEVENLPRTIMVEELKEKAEKYCPCVIAKDYDDAIDKISKEDTVFVFGSLYLAAALREKLKKFFHTT